MRRRRGVSAVVAAVLVGLTLSGCGGGSSPVGSSAGTTVAQTPTTPATTRPETATAAVAETTTAAASTAAALDSGRPLARLATACRSAPRLGGQPGEGIHALALRLAGRLQLMSRALGPGDPGGPMLAPVRHALGRLRRAVRRATSGPTPAVRQALRQAAAGLDAAVEQIGIPECAVAAGG